MNDLSCYSSSSHSTAAYQKAGKHKNPDGTVVNISGVKIGGADIVIMAGPCAIESAQQIETTAAGVQKYGANILRGGAFKPRTSPYSFQGLEEEGLKMIKSVSDKLGIPIVTEVMDAAQIELVSKYADILQVGSRNMHNYVLLKEIGISGKPVLLKRGMSATIDEFLMAAEYILNEGNEQVLLCERGIRTFETTTRNTLDLNAIPVLKHLSHLPVIVDPSHGTGYDWMVPAMAKAAIAAGADGLIMEVHYDPARARCDGGQSLTIEAFAGLIPELSKIAEAVNRKILLNQPCIA